MVSMEISRREPIVPSRTGSRDFERKRPRRRRELRLPDVVPESAPPRRRARRIVIALVILVAVVAMIVPIALWANYQMSYVVSRNALVKGSITNVGSQLQGVVTSVEVEAGQRARVGQILARFEDHQLRANVLRAESRIAEATARAASARAQIAAAHSQTDEATMLHQQSVSLETSGAISRNELRTSATKWRTAEALEMNAVANLRAVEAEVEAARGERALAKADLDAAMIRAPADGWVLRRIAEPGASVVVGQPVVALWIGQQVWVEAWIEEDQLGQIAVGNQVKVTIRPNRVFNGVVESIGVSTDFEVPEATVPQPRNARMRTAPVVGVRIRLDRWDGLFPGLSAVVAIRKNARQ